MYVQVWYVQIWNVNYYFTANVTYHMKAHFLWKWIYLDKLTADLNIIVSNFICNKGFIFLSQTTFKSVCLCEREQRRCLI